MAQYVARWLLLLLLLLLLPWRLPLLGTTGAGLARLHVPPPQAPLQQGVLLLPLLGGGQDAVLQPQLEPHAQLQAQQSARRVSSSSAMANQATAPTSPIAHTTHHVCAWHQAVAARFAGLCHRPAAAKTCCIGGGQGCRAAQEGHWPVRQAAASGDGGGDGGGNGCSQPNLKPQAAFTSQPLLQRPRMPGLPQFAASPPG